MRLKNPKRPVMSLPMFGGKCKWKLLKGEKSTSCDFVARLAALRPKMVAPFLRNSWGWLVAIPGWNVVNGISCSIYTFLVLNTSSICYQLGSHLGVCRVTGSARYGGLQSNGTTFYLFLVFHMTSPKFKLRNYRFFWVSTFMWYLNTLKTLHKKIFGSKGFFVLRYRTLEFPAYCVTRAAFSWRPGKLLCGLKTLRIFGDFAI